MTKPSSRRSQNGYLIEIPILLVLVVIVSSILMPNLPPLGQQVLLGIAALPVLFGLYYMIVIPGWTPDRSRGLKPPWSVFVFLLVALPVVAGVVMFIYNSAGNSS